MVMMMIIIIIMMMMIIIMMMTIMIMMMIIIMIMMMMMVIIKPTAIAEGDCTNITILYFVFTDCVQTFQGYLYLQQPLGDVS